MLPTPAIFRWSSRKALMGAVRPLASWRRCSVVNSSSNGSRPRRAAKNASSASLPSKSSPVPKRRGSTTARCVTFRERPPLSCMRTPTCCCAGSGAASTAPVIRRCWARWTSSEKLHTRYLPRRPSRSMRRPMSACSSSLGASGRDQRQSSTSIALSLRPSTSGASWRLIVSPSGSSGIRLAYEGIPRKAVSTFAGEPGEDAGAHVGERAIVTPTAEPAAGSGVAGEHLTSDGQQRRVLARVVGARVGDIDAVICSDDEEIVVAHVREHLSHAGVDLTQCAVEAVRVLAVPIYLVGLDQVGEHEAVRQRPEQLVHFGERAGVGGAGVRDAHTDAGEQVVDLAHAVRLHARTLELLQVAARGWHEREVTPAIGALERPLDSRERPCDHAPDGVLAAHRGPGGGAHAIKLINRYALDVRGELQHGVL